MHDALGCGSVSSVSVSLWLAQQAQRGQGRRNGTSCSVRTSLLYVEDNPCNTDAHCFGLTVLAPICLGGGAVSVTLSSRSTTFVAVSARRTLMGNHSVRPDNKPALRTTTSSSCEADATTHVQQADTARRPITAPPAVLAESSASKQTED